MTRLAGWANETANAATSACRLVEETLRIRERVLGPEHPNTLTSRNNLASGYLRCCPQGFAGPAGDWSDAHHPSDLP